MSPKQKRPSAVAPATRGVATAISQSSACPAASGWRFVCVAGSSPRQPAPDARCWQGKCPSQGVLHLRTGDVRRTTHFASARRHGRPAAGMDTQWQPGPVTRRPSRDLPPPIPHVQVGGRHPSPLECLRPGGPQTCGKHRRGGLLTPGKTARSRHVSPGKGGCRPPIRPAAHWPLAAAPVGPAKSPSGSCHRCRPARAPCAGRRGHRQTACFRRGEPSASLEGFVKSGWRQPAAAPRHARGTHPPSEWTGATATSLASGCRCHASAD